MKKTWVTAERITPPQEVLDAAGGDELLASILFRRGYSDAAVIKGFLDPDVYQPASAYELPGMAEAVSRLISAVKLHEKVLIWGDFDADGQTSTTILYEALSALGACVEYHIPLRESEGHGIHLATLQSYFNQGIQLVLTCDTGISEHQPVQWARQNGMDIIITDHHELPAQLPEGAVAMVNPRFLPAGHPLGSLPGCGVAYKLAEALLENSGNPIQPDSLLDLAALGIVADLAELRGDARYLLQKGLLVLRQNKRLGLAKLYELIDLDPGLINEEHLAFYLAPRLNVLGRLADANLAVDFFTTRDEVRAVYLAQELDGLNTRRKLITDQVLQGALAQIGQHPEWSEDALLVIDHPDWPGGVLGIVASALVNRYGKPVILLQTHDGQIARGSARSVEGINITAAITLHKEMLNTYGGHPMAAGLSLPVERVAEFRQVMKHTIAEMAKTAPPALQISLEAEVPLSDLTLELAERVNRLSPFGQGNPPPVIHSPLARVLQNTSIGKFKEHLTIRLEDPVGTTVDAIWWQGAGQELPQDWFQLAYTVRTSTFRGARQLQVEWLDWQDVDGLVDLPDTDKTVQIFDFRGIVDPLARLDEIRRSSDSVCIFAEGEMHSTVKGTDRTELFPANDLILLTFPAGLDEVSRVWKTVQPQKVFLFGLDTSMDQIEPFIRRLLGVMRFMVSKHGKTLSLEKLAAATAQNKPIVELGIKYLAARGELVIRQIQGDQVVLDWAQSRSSIQVNEAATRLERSLAETGAFRRNLMKIPAEEWRKTLFK